LRNIIDPFEPQVSHLDTHALVLHRGTSSYNKLCLIGAGLKIAVRHAVCPGSSNAACEMDARFPTLLFQQLFSRPARNCIHAKQARTTNLRSSQVQRSYAHRASQKEDDGSGNSSWQQRIHAFPKDVSKQLREYPRVSSNDLKFRTQRPKRVKMYTRDFIEGLCQHRDICCLY